MKTSADSFLHSLNSTKFKPEISLNSGIKMYSQINSEDVFCVIVPNLFLLGDSTLWLLCSSSPKSLLFPLHA